jgi:hypothetical protein
VAGTAGDASSVSESPEYEYATTLVSSSFADPAGAGVRGGGLATCAVIGVIGNVLRASGVLHFEEGEDGGAPTARCVAGSAGGSDPGRGGGGAGGSLAARRDAEGGGGREDDEARAGGMGGNERGLALAVGGADARAGTGSFGADPIRGDDGSNSSSTSGTTFRALTVLTWSRSSKACKPVTSSPLGIQRPLTYRLTAKAKAARRLASYMWERVPNLHGNQGGARNSSQSR